MTTQSPMTQPSEIDPVENLYILSPNIWLVDFRKTIQELIAKSEKQADIRGRKDELRHLIGDRHIEQDIVIVAAHRISQLESELKQLNNN
jgi:hypothetical protein